MTTQRLAQLDTAVDQFMAGQLSRRTFIWKLALLGLSTPAIAALVESCGGGSGPAATGGGTSLSDVEKVVYPNGAVGIPDYAGPNGNLAAALMPPEYHVAGDKGTWHWKYQDFKADKPYRLAYANAGSKIQTGVELGARMVRVAKSMGVTMDLYDNALDANVAIQNADIMIQKKYDWVCMFQVFPQTNKLIYQKLKAAGIGSDYLAIEATGEPNALLFDGGNFQECKDLGIWLGNYAKQQWGGQVDMVISAAQPRVGAYGEQRMVGYAAGIKQVLPNLPDSAFKTIDSQGALDEAQKRAADVLTANPNAKYILGVGTNDDASVGVVRALEAAGRAGNAAVAGQGGLPSAIQELQKPSSSFKVSAFFDIEEWAWMAAVGVLSVMGGKVSPYNLIPHFLYTKDNIKDFPPQIVFS
ncbi:MAG: sugar ABC transporter substrate-binding protein [Aggregatilineales bacterium]